MANDVIGLPEDGPGKSLDADSLEVAGKLVYRERGRIAGANAGDLQDVRAVDPGSADGGAVVRQAGPMNPTFQVFSNSTLAAAGSENFDCPAISAGGKLAKVIVASSRDCVWTVKSVSGGVETILGYLVSNGTSEDYEPPHKDYHQIPAEAFFRLTVENFDDASCGVFATVYYDHS